MTEQRQVQVEYTFEAPRELVFAAWMDPDQVAQWWAPQGFDVRRDTIEIDQRVGGRHVLCMVQQASGAEFWVRNEIVELNEPELLVLHGEAMPEVGLEFETVTRVELTDDGGLTRMALTSGPYTPQMALNAEAGWRNGAEQLAALVKEQPSA
jgi:uncharacterized protein YndB with AHSA1/START domain